MSCENDKAILNAIFNPLLPIYEQLAVEELVDEDKSNDPIKILERKGIDAAEEGNFSEAFEIFTNVIGLDPQRASGYNNRAQIHRLQGKTKDALEDLNKAIALSQGRRAVASQALCQRGLIYWKEDQKELAMDDFEAAAKLGNQFAKDQLVKLNPYAALCNQMMQKVFNNLYT